MRKFLLFVLLCCLASGIQAQRAALKTNVLEWCTATPNLGAEFVLGKHLSLNFEASGNPFETSKIGLRHATFRPEIRYWTGRPLSRHFIGVMGGISGYNLLLNDIRRRGNTWITGLTYGYDFVLSKHWNLELTAGVGCMNSLQYQYKDADPADPGRKQKERRCTFAPLKVGVTFIYIIK